MSIAVIGGYKLDKKDAVKTVEYYHFTTRKWSMLPELQNARYSASSCCHGSYIYVLVGKDNKGKEINTIERINLDYPDNWELIQPKR